MSARPSVVVLAVSALSATFTAAIVAPSAAASGGRPDGYTVSVLASAPEGATQPDDLALLGNELFVAFQNGVPPAGSGTEASTIAEYSRSGVTLATWSVVGHCDGLTADPAHNRLIGTVNEDGNSSLFTLDPSAPSGSQLTQYTYSSSSLPHGGGTDAISIYDGQILISASAPDTSLSSYPGVPAVYMATLSGTTADLTELFSDGATASVANVGPGQGKTTTLALTDPDSNEVVPGSGGRFGGDFVLDSQGDQQQVYMGGRHGNSPSQLSVLNLSQSINDTAWATTGDGTLYATDHAHNDVLAITGHFDPGTAFVVATPNDSNNPPPQSVPNYLAVLDLNTGNVTPFSGVPSPMYQPQGLLFVP